MATLRTLGNVIGGSAYFGKCAGCGAQFMSTHDRVAIVNGQRFCLRCCAGLQNTDRVANSHDVSDLNEQEG